MRRPFATRSTAAAGSPTPVPFQVTGEGRIVRVLQRGHAGQRRAGQLPCRSASTTTAPVVRVGLPDASEQRAGQRHGDGHPEPDRRRLGESPSTTYTIDGGRANTPGPFQITAGGPGPCLCPTRPTTVGNVEANKDPDWVQVQPAGRRSARRATMPRIWRSRCRPTCPASAASRRAWRRPTTAPTTATITTTAAISTLTASDTSTTFPGHLVQHLRGRSVRPGRRGLQVDASRSAARRLGRVDGPVRPPTRRPC